MEKLLVKDVLPYLIGIFRIVDDKTNKIIYAGNHLVNIDYVNKDYGYLRIKSIYPINSAYCSYLKINVDVI